MNDMDNITEMDDMKAMWNDFNNRLSRLEDENRRLAKHIMRNDYRSETERLAAQYKKYMTLELIWAVIMPVYILTTPNMIDSYRWFTAAVFCVYFLLAFITDRKLLMNLKKMDLYNAPVSEISKIAAHNWKIHKLWIIFSAPFAFVLILLLAVAFNMNTYILLGIGCGVIVGACIGIYQFLRFRKGYRLLQNNDDNSSLS